jgi:hypothetical protein
MAEGHASFNRDPPSTVNTHPNIQILNPSMN